METVKDLWASVVAYVSERTTNPLTSAFVLSWALWNYKFFVLLFSDESPSSTFAAIDALYPRPDVYYRGGFLYPAITALVYVFVYPYVTERVVKFYRKRQVSIANTLKTVEEQRVRTVAEVTRMVRAHEKALTAANEETANARAAMEDLRVALNKAEDEVATAQKTAEKSTSNQRYSIDDRLLEKIAYKGEVATNQGLEHLLFGKDNKENKENKDKFQLSPESRLSSRYQNPFSRRQLDLLTALTEGNSMSPAQMSAKLKLPQFWIDEELRDLTGMDLVSIDPRGQPSITDAGRILLRALIDEGKWAIEHSRANSSH